MFVAGESVIALRDSVQSCATVNDIAEQAHAFEITYHATLTRTSDEPTGVQLGAPTANDAAQWVLGITHALSASMVILQRNKNTLPFRLG